MTSAVSSADLRDRGGEPAEVNDERVCCGRDLLIGLSGFRGWSAARFKVNQMAVLANGGVLVQSWEPKRREDVRNV
ncbi:MAG: hypothetical protein ACTS41_01765 [Candidatus Hodgkinia cicadicola]